MVVISTERINCYGSRIITAGIDIEQYKRNPVLLYMHHRSSDTMPIGRMDDVHIDGDRLVGTPVFDMDDPRAAAIAQKWESGFLRMVSPGLEIIETSDAPEMLMPGQRYPTITRSKLIEVSIVDIGANDDALRLSRDCHLINDVELTPLINLNNNPKKTENMKEILLELGLPESATADEARAAIVNLKRDAENSRLATIDNVVDRAIAENRIASDNRQKFIDLGREIGIENLAKTLNLLNPMKQVAQRPSDIIDQKSAKTELRWADLTPEMAERLKQENYDEYQRLYLEEFGIRF